MKKVFLLLLIVGCVGKTMNAQTKQHKIVFEITSADTTQQVKLLRQINNVIKDVPGTSIEVVCHGQAIFMLVKDKTVTGSEMQALKDKYDVHFAACNNSMQRNKIDKSMLVAVATVVPNGVMEVVTKEEDGWSYIKAD